MYKSNNNIKIKSKIKESYTLNFVDDLDIVLSNLINNKNNIFVIDQTVSCNFKKSLITKFSNSRVLYINSGENSKTLDYIKITIENLIKLNIKRNDNLVAIGGGVTQDIVAFISTILFRGIEWSFFPTTLLAQCDSCIGSKSSINFLNFKNILGSFNPPNYIYINLNFLKSLTDLDIKSGIGEMYHYFIPFNLDTAICLNDMYDEVLNQRELLKEFIIKSLQIKKEVIEIDEFDKELRHVFNYGHTFGHAIESISNYQIVHGQAITMGMDLANYISLKLDLITLNDFNKLHNILFKNLPKFNFNNNNINFYFEALSKDKKNMANKLGCILIDKSFKIKKYFIDLDDNLKKWIIEYSEFYSK